MALACGDIDHLALDILRDLTLSLSVVSHSHNGIILQQLECVVATSTYLHHLTLHCIWNIALPLLVVPLGLNRVISEELDSMCASSRTPNVILHLHIRVALPLFIAAGAVALEIHLALETLAKGRVALVEAGLEETDY